MTNNNTKTNIGKINAYVCSNLHITITYDYDKGTTPFMISCRKCKAGATSKFYNVDPTKLIEAIWYIPCKEEYTELSTAVKEHVDMGGLIYKEIAKNTKQKVTAIEIEEYRNYAQVNYEKLKFNSAGNHPIVMLELQRLIDKDTTN